MLKNYYSLLNKYFYLFKNIIYSLFFLFNFTKKTNSDPNVYFIISNSKFWNSYFHIIFSFINSGYNVYIRFNLKLLAGTNKYSHWLFSKDLCRGFISYSAINKENSLIITDLPGNKILNNYNHINISPKLFANYSLKRLPYMMHPLQYQANYFNQLKIYRKSIRTTGIYFSGNTDPKIYDNSNITLRFEILTRTQIISTILNNIDTLVNIKSHSRDGKKKFQYDNQISINAWEWSISHSKNLNNRIDSSKWLEKLASCNFFICCPGIIIPFSHNAIEAMSVGTIPILQYSYLFDPPLINGVNCISFNNTNLLEVLIETINLDEDKVQSMRNEVIKYYEQYLTPNSNINIFKQALKDNGEVYFIDEVNEYFHSS